MKGEVLGLRHHKDVVTHQSPSPLCEVDKRSVADLPGSAGVGYETARSEDFNYGLSLVGNTRKYIQLELIQVRGCCYQMCMCTEFPILYKLLIAERRERSERSEANNRVLFEIPRYLYIYL